MTTTAKPTDTLVEKLLRAYQQLDDVAFESCLAELARLRADSRELAEMKAGGVWLQRCKLPLTDKSLRIAFWNGKEDRYVLNVFGEWWTLEKPHEGRDDGK